MLSPAMRRRWWGLIPLAIVTGVAEAVTTAGLFTVIALITEPERAMEPWLAAAAAYLPLQQPNLVGLQFAVLFAIGYLLRGGLIAASFYHRARVSHAAVSELAAGMLRRYLAAPYPVHLARNSATLIRNCTATVEEAMQGVLASGLALTADLITLGAVLGVLVWTSPLGFVAALAALAALTLLSLAATRRLAERQGKLVHALGASRIKDLGETFAGIKDIKVLGREPYFEARFAERHAAMRQVSQFGVTLNSIPSLTIQTTLISGGLIVFAVAALVLGPAALRLPTIAVIGYASLRALPLVAGLLQNLNIIRICTPAVGDLYQDFTALSAGSGDAVPGIGVTLRDSIALEDVGFSYPGAGRAAVERVSLTLRRGESLGIIGTTGAGKSTLVDLILGLLTPTRGRIRIDGVDVTGTAGAWRRLVGYVPQAVFLLDDSLRRNVALGIPDEEIDDARLQAVVRDAQLDACVAGLPDGLGTLVGERGVRLSGGERQRVAIARALYHDPDVLIFDEATSAVDVETEAAINRTIDTFRGRKTVIVVAHRLSSVRDCSTLIWLRDGAVVATGSFADLCRTNAQFRDLLELAVV